MTGVANDAFEAAIQAYGSLEGISLLMEDNDFVPGTWDGGSYISREEFALPTVKVLARPVHAPKASIYTSGPRQSAFDVALQFDGQLEDMAQFLQLNDVCRGEVIEGVHTYLIPPIRAKHLEMSKRLKAIPPSTAANTTNNSQSNPWLYPDGSPWLYPDGTPWLFPS